MLVSDYVRCLCKQVGHVWCLPMGLVCIHALVFNYTLNWTVEGVKLVVVDSRRGDVYDWTMSG